MTVSPLGQETEVSSAAAMPGCAPRPPAATPVRPESTSRRSKRTAAAALHDRLRWRRWVRFVASMEGHAGRVEGRRRGQLALALGVAMRGIMMRMMSYVIEVGWQGYGVGA